MPQQQPNLKWVPRIDFGEANFASAFCHLFSASLAISALLSNEWIMVDRDITNSTLLFDESPAELLYEVASRADKCQSIGCWDFWRPARFGGFVDQDGKTHIAFHSDQRVLLDCVTPLVANLFYVMIALCFVISFTSGFACFINVVPPPQGFLQWLRRNTILEMCNMMLTLCTCVTAIVAQTEVANIRHFTENVSIGAGVFFVSVSGLLNFFAAIVALKHTSVMRTRLNRLRRLDNQRLLCARSLRSWRDAARRHEDVVPIVDFERYLDSASVHEMTTTSSSTETTTESKP